MNFHCNKHDLSAHKVCNAGILLQLLLQWKLIYGMKQHIKEYLAFSIASKGAKAQHISMKTKMVNQCGMLTCHSSLIHVTKDCKICTKH
jgi:hypothetical protein